MKILLVNPPCRIPNVLPLGLGYIASVLRQEGHAVSLMDLNAQNKTFEEIERELEILECDLIGIGGLTTTYKFVKHFSVLSKRAKPSVKIMAGNMVSTSSPELLLTNSDIDICVIDEGEETVRELVQKIKDFPNIENVRGIIFKKDGQLITTAPRSRIKDLDKLPFPAWDLFPMETYINTTIHREYGRRSINISAVRGCPFQCLYCSRPFGGVVYKRSIESVISEMKELMRRYRIQFICFSDDLFMVDRRWIMKFCDTLIAEGIKVGWSSSARVNLVDMELLKKMRAAGCEILGYGFESGSQKILDRMKKNVTVEQAEKAVRLTRRAGIIVEGSFMIGMIGETEETVKESVDFIKRADLPLHRFFYTTPYPKTPLYEMAKNMGRLPADEDAYISSLGEMYNTLLVNLTDMPAEKLRNLKDKAEEEIKKSLSLRSRLEILDIEVRRVFTDIKRRINNDGILSTLPWLFEKTGEKIRH